MFSFYYYHLFICCLGVRCWLRGDVCMCKCPIKCKEVGCDRVCVAVVGSEVKICSVRLKALDLALNCR